MTAKQFKFAQMISAFVIAIAASQSVATNNFLLLVITVAVAAPILFWVRSQVKEVMADERDYAIGGIAARWAIQVYSFVAVIGMVILYSQRSINPFYEAIASTLAYSTCFLMILYTLIFRYHQRLKFLADKTAYAAVGIILIIVLIIAGIRLFSGEDDWICQGGQWIKHGNPSYPAPQVECRK